MRLLLISTDFPPDVGGTQTYAAELACRLDARYEQFAVVAPYVVGCDAVDEQSPYPIYRVRGSIHLFAFRASFLIARLAHRDGYDAVYCVSWIGALSVIGSVVTSVFVRGAVSAQISSMISSMKAAMIPGTQPASEVERPRLRPLILTAAHGRELLFNPFNRLPILRSGYTSLRRLALRMSTRVYPVSRFTRDLLIQTGVDPEKIFLLPNGTNPIRFAPSVSSSLREVIGAADRCVILTTGRLVPRKGIDLMLQAMPDVLSSIPNALYVIVGSGPEKPRLMAEARLLALGDRVLFVEEIAHEKLPTWYNTCDVFVLPVRDNGIDVEGFGIVLLEASASQKPVIATNAGGVADAVVDGETGILVPQNSSPALADAVIQLFENPDRARQMGHAGRQHVLRAANWDRVVSDLHASIVETVLACQSTTQTPKTAPFPFSFFRF